MAPCAIKKRKLSHSEPESANASEGNIVESAVSEAEHVNMKGQHGLFHANSFADTPTPYKTSMFHMKIEELISEVQPIYEKRVDRLDKVLQKLKEVIEKIPPQAPLSVTDAERKFRTQHHIYIPFPTPRPSTDAKYTFAYDTPASINIVGSYARKTMVKSDSPLMVDIAIIMPRAIFHNKDYLDYRYFYKRAYYLACIAVGIEESKICKFSACYNYQNNCHLQPILLLDSVNDGSDNDFSSTKSIIRILLGAETNAFLKNRTLPWSSCLRAMVNKDSQCSLERSSTPIYNATLRAECSIESYLTLLHRASIASSGFKDACILGATWLRQRGFGTGIRNGGFGPFELATTTLLILQARFKENTNFPAGYSGYQLFKTLLQFLASRDLAREPLLLFVDHTEYSAFHKSDTPLLFDGKRSLNLLYKMSAWSYNELRQEASVSLQMLNYSLSDRFQPCFISKVNNSILKFDGLLQVLMPKSWVVSLKDVHLTDPTLAFCAHLYKILYRGLGDRVISINIKAPEHSSWSITDPNPYADWEPKILIGLTFNPSQVSRAVDHGPPAENKKAASSFRKFWGEKAELRRFKDGSILESLIWGEKHTKRSICEEIITYVIKRHMGQNVAEGIKFATKPFNRMLRISRVSTSSLAIYEPIQSAYEDLQKHIRNLQGLPLQIRQVSASCADLRYTSVLPHVPNDSKTPMDIMIQLEASARWPDDIQAIQRTKIAFLLKMGELLEVSIPGLATRIGLEHKLQKLHNLAFLDVVYPDTVTFRLRIHHDRELALLYQQLKDKTADPGAKEQAAIAVSAYKRTFIQAPSHTQALQMLCTRFPLLSPSIRLMKHWRNSHLLSSHIKDELIELLVIRTFVEPHPWQPPASIHTGFLRTLFFIAKWDWRSEPLIVDLDGSMTADDVIAINTRFEAWRKIDPAMNRTVLFAASNLDQNGVSWTEQAPTKVMAARFNSLAKAANSLVREQGMDVDVMALFRHSMSDYDFMINLDDKFCEGRHGREEKRSSFKNIRSSSQGDPGLVGYDPVQLFIEEVQRVYGDSVVLLYDSAEMSVIAGLWSPHTGPRAWKVGLAYSSKPLQDRDSSEGDHVARVTINKIAILNDIARLGGDLVARIVRRE